MAKDKLTSHLKLADFANMGRWRNVLVIVCWLASLLVLGVVIRHNLIQIHWYGFDAYFVRTSFPIYAPGICCVACLIGARNAPRGYWVNFAAIFAVQAVCFAIALHYLAEGRLIVKDVDGTYVLTPL